MRFRKSVRVRQRSNRDSLHKKQAPRRIPQVEVCAAGTRLELADVVARIWIGCSTVSVRAVLLRSGRHGCQSQLSGVVVCINGLTHIVHRAAVWVINPAIAGVPTRISCCLTSITRDLGRHPRHHGVGHGRRLLRCHEACTPCEAAVVAGTRVVPVHVRLRDAARRGQSNKRQNGQKLGIHTNLLSKIVVDPKLHSADPKSNKLI